MAHLLIKYKKNLIFQNTDGGFAQKPHLESHGKLGKCSECEMFQSVKICFIILCFVIRFPVPGSDNKIKYKIPTAHPHLIAGGSTFCAIASLCLQHRLESVLSGDRQARLLRWCALW